MTRFRGVPQPLDAKYSRPDSGLELPGGREETVDGKRGGDGQSQERNPLDVLEEVLGSDGREPLHVLDSTLNVVVGNDKGLELGVELHLSGGDGRLLVSGDSGHGVAIEARRAEERSGKVARVAMGMRDVAVTEVVGLRGRGRGSVAFKAGCRSAPSQRERILPVGNVEIARVSEDKIGRWSRSSVLLCIVVVWLPTPGPPAHVPTFGEDHQNSYSGTGPFGLMRVK